MPYLLCIFNPCILGGNCAHLVVLLVKTTDFFRKFTTTLTKRI